MGYQSTTIAKTIPDINDHIFLPGIQREFVWDTDQILQLYDSVVRGYPIGSFLYWKVRGKYAEDQIKYQFIKHYITEGTYPDEFEDVHHRNPKLRDQYNDIPDTLTLVLDGQQRLTSFYLGLCGSLTDRGHRRHRKKPESWTRKQLYINLLSNPSIQTEDHLQLKYDLQFKKPDPEHSRTAYWFRVGDILNVSTDERYALVDDVIDELESCGVSPDAINWNHIDQNLNELWNAVHERDIINYYRLEETDSDKILDIFIRANEGGTQLGKESILLSMATAQWSNTNPAIDARKQITTLVDKLNSYNAPAGFDFDISFVLRNLLAASGLRIIYDIEYFTNDENLLEMKQTWQDPEFEKALFDTLDLLNSFGLDGHAISSSTSLIPIVYFFYNNDAVELSWDAKQGRKTRKKLFYWLCTSLLKGVYHARSYTMLSTIRNVIQNAPDGTFPLEALHEELRGYGESLTFVEEEARNTIQQLRYGNKRVEVFLALLYFPDPANEHMTFDVDHIFPQSELARETLVDDYDFGFNRAQHFEALRDSVRNLQLLTPEENNAKSDMPYDEWLATRRDSQYDRHYLPRNTEMYDVERFEQFIQDREQLLVDRLIHISDEMESVFSSDEPPTTTH